MDIREYKNPFMFFEITPGTLFWLLIVPLKKHVVPKKELDSPKKCLIIPKGAWQSKNRCLTIV